MSPLPSSYEKVVCPDCGARLEDPKPVCEEVAVAVETDKIDATQRTFSGRCPSHGAKLVSSMGNHATYLEKRLKDRFRPYRRQITAELDREGVRRFKEALEGRRYPPDEEIAVWDHIVANSEKGSRS